MTDHIFPDDIFNESSASKEAIHPLEIACRYIRQKEEAEAIKILHEHQAIIHGWKNKYDNSIVNVAAWNGCVEVLKYLATISAPIFDDPETSVFGARSIKVLEFLNERGLLKPNAIGKHGTTPLQQACNASEHFIPRADETLIPERLLCIDYLVNAGADVNALNDDGRTAAMGAAYIGAHQFVTRLVELGADISPSIRCNKGKSTIDYAMGEETTLVIRRILIKLNHK